MKITMEGKYQTRDGRKVEILRTNVKNENFPIVGILTQRDGEEQQDRWTADGHYFGNGDSESDIISITTKYEGWMVIVQKADPCGNRVYPDRIFAEIACSIFAGEHVVHVTWEN